MTDYAVWLMKKDFPAIGDFNCLMGLSDLIGIKLDKISVIFKSNWGLSIIIKEFHLAGLTRKKRFKVILDKFLYTLINECICKIFIINYYGMLRNH